MTIAVEALLAVEQLLPERDDVAADDAGLEQGLLGLQLGVLDPLGNLDLLLARQQRHLAHLLEVHAHRIVEDVVLRRARFLLLGLLLALLVAVDLVRIEDVDLEVLEDGDDVLDVLRIVDALRQGVVDVVEGQVALLLREADEVADLLVDAGAADRRISGPVGARPRPAGRRARTPRRRRARRGRRFWRRGWRAWLCAAWRVEKLEKIKRQPAAWAAGGVGVGARCGFSAATGCQRQHPSVWQLFQVLSAAGAARARGPAGGAGPRWPPCTDRRCSAPRTAGRRPGPFPPASPAAARGDRGRASRRARIRSGTAAAGRRPGGWRRSSRGRAARAPGACRATRSAGRAAAGPARPGGLPSAAAGGGGGAAAGGRRAVRAWRRRKAAKSRCSDAADRRM